jgi:predicted RND superfamily exporter protein
MIVSVEAETTEILLHPDTLIAADGLCAYLTTRVPNVGKVMGFTDMVKRVNQMFNGEESPDGIQAANRANRDFEDDAFGFGDFELGDTEGEVSPSLQTLFLEKAFSATPSAGRRPATPPAQAETPITFAMLKAALGKNANMTASELARELERITNYEGYSYYEIPANPARYGKTTPEELEGLVANYLVLLAGNSDDSFSNDPLEPTAFETIVLVNSQWQKDTNRVINEINRYAAANFPKNVKVVIGGGAIQEGAISSLATHSQIISIIIAVATVFLIIAVANKSLIAGLIAVIPLSIAILCNFAVMGFLHITLNMGTAMLASLTVGIGIDYTIHFIETFKREANAGGDYLRRTFATSGKAIIINAVSVGASFAVLCLSRFRIMGQFGALVCMSMGISAIVSLTVIPVLLEAVRPSFIFGKNSALR